MRAPRRAQRNPIAPRHNYRNLTQHYTPYIYAISFAASALIYSKSIILRRTMIQNQLLNSLRIFFVAGDRRHRVEVFFGGNANKEDRLWRRWIWLVDQRHDPFLFAFSKPRRRSFILYTIYECILNTRCIRRWRKCSQAHQCNKQYGKDRGICRI